jgi:hypothetical protein
MDSVRAWTPVGYRTSHRAPFRGGCIIAEGLDLLAEQAVTLRADATALFDAGHRRGHAVLAAHADEESAKALILLDLVRAGGVTKSRLSVKSVTSTTTCRGSWCT